MKYCLAVLICLCSLASAQVTVTCPAFPCNITVNAPPPPPPPTVIRVTPVSLTFAALINTDSEVQYVTVENLGTVALPQVNAMAGAGFQYAGLGTCSSSTVPPGKCTISVKYHPTGTLPSTGTVTVTAGTPGVVTVVTLNGSTTIPAPVLKPNLSWTASTVQVAGYNIFRSTVKGGPYTVVNTSLITTTSYRDTNAAPATTYYYVAQAVNAAGNTSAFSNEVQVVIP